MAQRIVTGFSDESMRAIQRDHTTLKMIVNNLRRDFRAQADDGPIVRMLTGRTGTTSAHPSYPTDGNTFCVLITDFWFSETTGDQDMEARDVASRFVIARAWDGCYVPENTAVMLRAEHAIGNGWRWWITGHKTRYKATAASDIASGDSGLCDAYHNGSVSFSTDAWFDWMQSGVAEIASGTEVIIEWFADQKKWVIVAAECQA